MHWRGLTFIERNGVSAVLIILEIAAVAAATVAVAVSIAVLLGRSGELSAVRPPRGDERNIIDEPDPACYSPWSWPPTDSLARAEESEVRRDLTATRESGREVDSTGRKRSDIDHEPN